MDHDRLFKELLRTNFLEFLAIFAPEVLEFLDVSSIEFLDKEVFTDISSSERHEVDLLVKVRFKGRDTFFLIHVENQATSWKDFAARMFRYFAMRNTGCRSTLLRCCLTTVHSAKSPIDMRSVFRI